MFFPIFLALTWRLGRRWVLGLLAGVFVVSLTTAQWGSFTTPTAAFFLLPTRGWELLMGALVAFYLLDGDRKSIPRAVRELGGVIGIALITYAVLVFDEDTPFPGLYALAPTIGTAMIIVCATTSTVAGRLLGSRVLVGVGLMSYSAYLWHQPMLAFARHRSIEEPAAFLRLFVAVSSLPLAYLSWRYVETPFRAKGGFTRRNVFCVALGGTVFFAGVGLFQHSFSNQYQRLWLARQPRAVQTMSQIITESREHKSYAAGNIDGNHSGGGCRFNVERITAEVEERIRSCLAKHEAGVAILGDSHAIDLFGIALAGSQARFIVGVTQPGCRAHTPDAGCQYDEFLSFVQKNKGVFQAVIYEQAAFYLLRTQDKRGGRAIFSRLGMGEAVTGVFIDEQRVEAARLYLRSC